MDAGLDENEAEFRVFVLSVTLEMLAYRDSLLDEHCDVLKRGADIFRYLYVL